MKQRIIDIVYEAKPDDVSDFSVILDFKQCNDILVKVKFLENYIHLCIKCFMYDMLSWQLNIDKYGKNITCGLSGVFKMALFLITSFSDFLTYNMVFSIEETVII